MEGGKSVKGQEEADRHEGGSWVSVTSEDTEAPGAWGSLAVVTGQRMLEFMISEA